MNNCFSFEVINELMVYFKFTTEEVRRVYPSLEKYAMLNIHKFVSALCEKNIVSESNINTLLAKLKDIDEAETAKNIEDRYEESKKGKVQFNSS